MRRHVRMATRDDPLLPGPPAAYELTVQTGSTGAAGTDGRLTFTIRGVLGVCKKTVDTSLRGGILGIGADGRSAWRAAVPTTSSSAHRTSGS